MSKRQSAKAEKGPPEGIVTRSRVKSNYRKWSQDKMFLDFCCPQLIDIEGRRSESLHGALGSTRVPPGSTRGSPGSTGAPKKNADIRKGWSSIKSLGAVSLVAATPWSLLGIVEGVSESKYEALQFYRSEFPISTATRGVINGELPPPW